MVGGAWQLSPRVGDRLPARRWLKWYIPLKLFNAVKDAGDKARRNRRGSDIALAPKKDARYPK